MFRKSFVVFVFLAMVATHTVFSQSVTINTALATAAREISTAVPQGTRIAVLNISADSAQLSDYIINELIVNLVNTRAFNVVPRSNVELSVAQGEFDFQMSGYVSQENQRRFGQFLEAGTIVTGAIVRETSNSYRLTINAIHLQNFTYQHAFRTSVLDDNMLKTFSSTSGRGYGRVTNNYTIGERLGMSAKNIFFGAGSLSKGHYSGLFVTFIQSAGMAFVILGIASPLEAQIYADPYDPYDPYPPYNPYPPGPQAPTAPGESGTSDGNFFLDIGVSMIAGGAVLGLIIPFFHTKPAPVEVTQDHFPFSLDLVSSNRRIDGLRLSYTMKF